LTRLIDVFCIENIIINAKEEEEIFCVVSNMGTTMFGAVDNPDILEKHQNTNCILMLPMAVSVYPFSNKDSVINFDNQNQLHYY
jgi:hypothetical protein